MDYCYELTVNAKTENEKEDFKKYWMLSFCYDNKIIQETSNTIVYNFILDMILCYDILPDLYKLYPKLKFKLLINKYEHDINYYRGGIIKGCLYFGAYKALKEHNKFMVNVIDYSTKIYLDRCKLLFNKMVKCKYKDGTLILDFFDLINTYFYYRSDAKEYIKKRKLFFELYAKLDEPLLKEYFEKEYIQNLKIDTTADGF